MISTTEQTIINRLRTGPADSFALANATGVRRESVRRSLQTLRKAGWNISYGKSGDYMSTYILHRPEQTAQVATA